MTVNAAAATLSGIAVTGPSSVNEGGTATYTATATWSDSSTTTVTPTWTENSQFASISASGVLTAQPVTSNQTVTVTAVYASGGVSKTATMTVTILDAAATLNGIAISGPSTVNEGGTGSFTATASWSDGTSSNVTSQATWTTSLGTIDSSGVLTAPSVTGDQTATVGASYASGGATRTTSRDVTVTDTPADPSGDLNVTVSPPDMATDVPVTTVIAATSTDSSDISSEFNENTFALRADSITMSATRAGDEEHYWGRDDDDDDSACIRSGIVVGTIAYDDARITATFTPVCKLAHGMTYTATIAPALSVQAGSTAAEPLSWSFTTIARTPDADDDGVQDGEDDRPDDDGEATPPKSKGRGKHKLSVKRHPGSRLRKVTGISDTHSGINQAGKPAGYEFRDGLVNCEIQGVPPGGTVEVDLTLTEPVPAGSKVYTASTAGFREVANPSIQGNTLTLKLIDGGAGDGDGTANGVIVESVGVAAPVASGGGSLDLSTSSSSGGGCTVAPGSASGGAGAVAPLVLLLIGAAVRRFRKTGRRG
jgi:hypothetical protein